VTESIYMRRSQLVELFMNYLMYTYYTYEFTRHRLYVVYRYA